MTTIQPRRALWLAACLGVVSGACAVSPSSTPQHEASVFSNPPAMSASEAQLYARDGSVVGPQGGAAAVQERGAPTRREVGEGESGRMYLLELYQQVIDERDSLSREVRALRADVEILHGTQSQSHARILELEEQTTTLSAERERLQAESLDLAARLTTAQIRRLQAERLLLEHKIAEQKMREAAQVEEASAKERKP